MIKLENISTIEFLTRMQREGINNRFYRHIYEIMKKYNLDNFQKVKDFLDSNSIELNYELIREVMTEYLNYVKGKIDEANLIDKKPEIFTFETYNHSNIDDKTLKITDESNKGNVLLYADPLLTCGRRKNTLKRLSISEIKYLLSHLDDYNLENTLANIRSFGIGTCDRVVDMITLYEEQVLRQAKETEEREINLFTVNKSEKDEVVAEEIKYIAEYLVDNADELIWGELTDTAKKRIMSAILGRSEQGRKNRQLLIDTISNYTTLSELEAGVIKKKTLNRFIVK